MRETDQDCVQSHEDFTYVIPDTEPADTQHQPTDDDTATKVVKKNPGSGLDSLGGGRLT
ncbi:hypothetical protein PS718_00281 [Pseudomonas fluorescens]|uniref:Uncharacterized protein n=1 Tax=Pseudomonas fluorescens TaxID=294 RepID=A0A5E6ZXF2_PSEFL|nr:hypothetical protein [Pseudomonas fluorescens]VVN68891.1 hypothetical protein PS718_00281 [Pseudomonas fluorescens]